MPECGHISGLEFTAVQFGYRALFQVSNGLCQVILQDKGHHQAAVTAQMVEGPVDNVRKVSARAADKDGVGFFCQFHRRIGVNYPDLRAIEMATVLFNQRQRFRFFLDSNNFKFRMIEGGLNRDTAGTRTHINQKPRLG